MLSFSTADHAAAAASKAAACAVVKVAVGAVVILNVSAAAGADIVDAKARPAATSRFACIFCNLPTAPDDGVTDHAYNSIGRYGRKMPTRFAPLALVRAEPRSEAQISRYD